MHWLRLLLALGAALLRGAHGKGRGSSRGAGAHGLAGAGGGARAALRERLLNESLYSRLDPPWELSSEPIEVELHLEIRKVTNVDITSGSISLSVWYTQSWWDFRLEYNGTDEFGVFWNSSRDFISMEPESVWTPDIQLYDTTEALFTGEDFTSTMVQLFDSQGGSHSDKLYNARWSQPGTVKTKCKFNLTDFPFDKPGCKMRFGSWLHPSHVLTIKPEGNVSSLDKLGLMEYDLDQVSWANETRNYAVGNKSEVILTLQLARVPHYYVANAVMPMALIVVLSVLTCWLPLTGEGSGERISYAVTMLLTVVAVTLFTAEARPPIQDDTWLDRYQATCTLLSALPVIESVVLLHWTNTTAPLFEKMRKAEKEAKKEAKKRKMRVAKQRIPEDQTVDEPEKAKSSAGFFDSSKALKDFAWELAKRGIRPAMIDNILRHAYATGVFLCFMVFWNSAGDFYMSELLVHHSMRILGLPALGTLLITQIFMFYLLYKLFKWLRKHGYLRACGMPGAPEADECEEDEGGEIEAGASVSTFETGASVASLMPGAPAAPALLTPGAPAAPALPTQPGGSQGGMRATLVGSAQAALSAARQHAPSLLARRARA